MISRSRGFTLVEALIGLVVLSVGLLGASAMLLGSLRSQGQSLRRAAELELLRDMAGRIRANATAGAAYEFGGSAASSAPSCDVTACTPPELAAFDLAAFQRRLVSQLPPDAVTARIHVEPAAGTTEPSRFLLSLDDATSGVPVALALCLWPAAGGVAR